jgi:hypothetical protein
MILSNMHIFVANDLSQDIQDLIELRFRQPFWQDARRRMDRFGGMGQPILQDFGGYLFVNGVSKIDFGHCDDALKETSVAESFL